MTLEEEEDVLESGRMDSGGWRLIGGLMTSECDHRRFGPLGPAAV
jgi:hypothetical protein